MPIGPNVRRLIEAVSERDVDRACQEALAVLAADKTKGNAGWRDRMSSKLQARMLKPKVGRVLPSDIQGKLRIVDSVSELEYARYELTGSTREVISHMRTMSDVAGRLAELGVSYANATLLYGESGCGKTTLARMAAYELELPFAYVDLARLIDSYLGKTALSVAKCLDYVRDFPCVLLLDELDALASARTGGNDGPGAELGRVAITLMQELDNLPSTVVLVGATNRPDILDPAISRRFTYKAEVCRCKDPDEILALAETFLEPRGGYGIDLDAFYEFEGKHPDATAKQSSVVAQVVDALARHIKQGIDPDVPLDVRWEAML